MEYKYIQKNCNLFKNNAQVNRQLSINTIIGYD